MAKRPESNHQKETPLCLDAAAGALIGAVAEAVALEGFVHQDLSHRTLRYRRPLAAASRAVMILFGLSPNRAALRHRLHHLNGNEEPASIPEAIASVIATTGGVEDVPDDISNDLFFDGYDRDTDPLIREEDGAIGFANDPVVERLASKNLVTKILPGAAATLCIAAINKATGRSRPLQRAALLTGAAFAVTGGSFVETAYAEARSGRVNDQMNIKGALAPAMRLHQAHHDKPWDYRAGTRKRQVVAFNLLQRTGLVDTHPIESEPAAA